MGLNTELMSSSMHIGTHIDALSHFTTENDNHWYNGFSGDRYSTNFGPAKCDIAPTPPMVMRGVLLDIAGYKGVTLIPNNYIATAEDCEGCAAGEGVTLEPGDAALVRLGNNWRTTAAAMRGRT